MYIILVNDLDALDTFVVSNSKEKAEITFKKLVDEAEEDGDASNIRSITLLEIKEDEVFGYGSRGDIYGGKELSVWEGPNA